MQIRRAVVADKPVDQVFDYLSDFTNTTDWDPGTVSVGSGTRVTYTADFDFKGVTKYLAPVLAPAFKKLGDEAEKGMQSRVGPAVTPRSGRLRQDPPYAS